MIMSTAMIPVLICLRAIARTTIPSCVLNSLLPNAPSSSAVITTQEHHVIFDTYFPTPANILVVSCKLCRLSPRLIRSTCGKRCRYSLRSISSYLLLQAQHRETVPSSSLCYLYADEKLHFAPSHKHHHAVLVGCTDRCRNLGVLAPG